MAGTINFTTVLGIRRFAEANYEKGGHWIVECWSDEDISLFIRHRSNGREVRRDLYKLIKRYNEEEQEVLAEVF